MVTAAVRPVLRRAAVTTAFGGAAGAVCLGLGGRLVMWLFALASGRTPVVTVRGTLGVALAGAIAGAVDSLLFLAVRRLLPTRVAWRGVVFAALCYVVAIPGFRPPQLLVFALFAPLFLAYGVALVGLDARRAAAAGERGPPG